MCSSWLRKECSWEFSFLGSWMWADVAGYGYGSWQDWTDRHGLFQAFSPKWLWQRSDLPSTVGEDPPPKSIISPAGGFFSFLWLLVCSHLIVFKKPWQMLFGVQCICLWGPGCWEGMFFFFFFFLLCGITLGITDASVKPFLPNSVSFLFQKWKGRLRSGWGSCPQWEFFVF